ncbi:MAG: adenosylmethionine decarboxylase [Candidatus Hodarchaeota archaeon]
MFGNSETFFYNIAERSNLYEGTQGVNRIVLEMFRRQNEIVSNKELARIVGIPVPVISAVRSELINAGFLKTKSILSAAAIDWIKRELKLKFSQEFLEEFVSASSSNVPQKYLEFFSPVIKYLNDRPPPEYKYDQSRSTPETVIKRALLMLNNGDLEGKRIVILGDDDGVSIALSFLRCAEEIFVIDIDPRVLEFIDNFSSQYRVSDILHTQLWDIRASFPKKWWHKFNTFETDPPYTVLGFKLFLNQAITLMNFRYGVKGYISFGAKTPQKTWACQEHLLSSGFMINEYIQNFNRYHGATLLGNTSNMYIVSLIQHKTRLIDTKQPELAIYTFDEDKIRDIPTIGYQIIAEFYGVKSVFLTDIQRLKNIIKNGIVESGLILEEIFTKEYSPYGLSVIAILVESHCHIHTWPEHNYLSLDLFVCEQAKKAEDFFMYLIQNINPLDYHKFQFFRGKPPLNS